jgi:hypothetical protein
MSLKMMVCGSSSPPDCVSSWLSEALADSRVPSENMNDGDSDTDQSTIGSRA